MELSNLTQAALLLTSPLLANGVGDTPEVLTRREYRLLVAFLEERGFQPSDLVTPDAGQLIAECNAMIGSERLTLLLNRGFLLSQSVEHWNARSIWVVGRGDRHYPSRLEDRLGLDAPIVLYGSGDHAFLEMGGLAVVGSRNVDESLIQYAEAVGRLTAESGHPLVSGGAKGIDQAAMRGAIEGGGFAVGVLGDSLERAALARENRELIINRQLILVTPYDPLAGFHVGRAMQRNKLIYALADAALVVNSDLEKGGTWAGAVEQLGRLHLVPVYVRTSGELQPGNAALLKKGALPWPDPPSPGAVGELLRRRGVESQLTPPQEELFPQATARPTANRHNAPLSTPRRRGHTIKRPR